jgi:hypothetical protein
MARRTVATRGEFVVREGNRRHSLSFPVQSFPIKLELQLDVLAPRFFDAITERAPTGVSGSRWLGTRSLRKRIGIS